MDDAILYNPNTAEIDEDAYNVTSTLFAIVALSIIGVSFAIPFMHSHMQLLKEEIAQGLHHSLPCWVALLAMEIPIYVMAASIMALLMYSLISVQTSSGKQLSSDHNRYLFLSINFP